MVSPICGPKLSAYCSILSVWGIVMLGLLGLFFQIRSPTLIEDIPLENWNGTYSEAVEKFEQTAMNCWIAAGIYVVLFIFSFVQQRMHSRASYEMS
ncbi:hypothetical protein LOTGIDRAFT_233363 [Lottia gigantea]|uniref:Uncharacterized protein n=1 Tax=Lottia gigantea TaxID=225164 RepID=V4A4C9_LOTGI|nr:hypothetical protein LOTGIDRAFT_233363 [Lottia gigantea]ESO91552.1 hypothetical protein LOTGIDRAFT_233363 [Lottia gigantea]